MISTVKAFWGLEGHFPTWFPSDQFYLVSAASLWWSKRGKFVRRSYPNARNRMFLDSGGFSFFSKAGDYPFRPDEYLRLVEHPYYGYQPLLWASLDYPCEPEVHRDHKLISNADRIEATLDHLAYFTAHAEHPGLVPVVQGYTLDERLNCCDEIFKRGMNRSLMALGSLCALQSVAEIAGIVRDLSFYFPGQRWHLFGVKISYLARGNIPATVFSFDTAAWGLGQRGETKNPKRFEREARFWRYREKYENVWTLGPHKLTCVTWGTT